MKPVTYALICTLTVSSLIVSPFVRADIFISPLLGYSFSTSEFDIKDNDANNLTDEEELKLSESGYYAVMLGVTTQDPGDIYLIYTHQATELRTTSSPTPVIDLDLDYLHIGGSLYFPHGKLKPYVTTSLGLTSMRPNGAYSNESFFSIAFGGGIDYQLTPSFSLLADARGYATFIDSDTSLFCNNGACLWSISSELMWQGQVNLGVKLKF